MNARRNSALSEDWFTHKSVKCPDNRPVPRVRLAGCEIRAKNIEEARYAEEAPVPMRLRTEEALQIALQSRSQKAENWHDYENNQNYFSERPPLRIGASEAGREIAEKYLKSKDILSNNSKGDFQTDEKMIRRPQSAKSSANDWFYHQSHDADTVLHQRPKVYHDGLEYALRNRGEQDLLMHDPRASISGEIRPYACPSAESRENANQATSGENMAQVLGANRSDLSLPSRAKGAVVKGAEGEYYRTRDREGFLKPGNEEFQLPKSRLRPEAREIMEKSSSSSAMSRLLQQSLSATDAQNQKVHRLPSDEARQFLERQQSGVMNSFIGSKAHSTGFKYKKKILPRGLNSQEGVEAREKNLGTAAKELISNSNLEPQIELVHKKGVENVPNSSLNFNLVPQNEEFIRKALRLQGQDAMYYANKQNSGFDVLNLMNYKS